MLNMYYRLDENNIAVPCETMEWAKSLEDRKKCKVGNDVLDDGIHISTVFLGINHSWQDSEKPILFETMIFGGKHDEYQERCSTWKEAEIMHEKAVKLAKE